VRFSSRHTFLRPSRAAARLNFNSYRKYCCSAGKNALNDLAQTRQKKTLLREITRPTVLYSCPKLFETVSSYVFVPGDPLTPTHKICPDEAGPWQMGGVQRQADANPPRARRRGGVPLPPLWPRPFQVARPKPAQNDHNRRARLRFIQDARRVQVRRRRTLQLRAGARPGPRCLGSGKIDR